MLEEFYLDLIMSTTQFHFRLEFISAIIKLLHK